MPRITDDGLSCAQLALGETVIDPARWPKVMEQVCSVAGATGALLLQTDVRTPDVPRTDSIDELVKFYFRHGWQNRDIRATRAVPLLLEGKRVFADQDILTIEELRSKQFFNECMRPKGFHWAAGVAFSAGPALWALCLHRGVNEEPFGAEDLRILGAFPERLTEVATLSNAVGRVALSSAIDALALVQQPAVAVDRFGRVIDSNCEANKIFDIDFQVRNHRLVATDRRASTRLQTLFDRLHAMAEDAPLATEPIIVRRTTRSTVVVRVLPVHPVARSPFLGARILLTFSPVETRAALDKALLTNLFSLTPAEIRLAGLMVDGVSPEAAAEQLCVTRETARNQLKSIFAKTGAHRQAELVAMLANLRR
jgi:DNA-binding CsgD family transcriptional regulator